MLDELNDAYLEILRDALADRDEAIRKMGSLIGAFRDPRTNGLDFEEPEDRRAVASTAEAAEELASTIASMSDDELRAEIDRREALLEERS